MSKDKKKCDLCGLPVEIKGFKTHTVHGDKDFCCEGCKGIYEMLNESELLTEPTDSDKPTTLN